jgi:hypothetical protein
MTQSSRRLKTVRTESDYALAARMLLRLKNGGDIRPARLAQAREQFRAGLLDDAAKLDRAMDILMDEIETDLIDRGATSCW